MNQTAVILIVSIVVVALLVRNHFSLQEIDLRIFIPPMVMAVVFAGFSVRYPDFKEDASGLILRFLLGLAIGVLQGCLSRVFESNGSVVSRGTKVGLAFWLIFIPVRLLILPWFSRIAPGRHNLDAPSLLGISALCLFIGFFLSKGMTLFIRKVKLEAA